MIRSVCFALAAAVVLAGCAATPTLQTTRPMTADVSRYKAVQVIVDGSEQIRKTAGFDNTSAALLTEFADNLKATGRYSQIGAEVRDAKPLLARLTITELNYVHGATRGMTGILAGRAILSVTLTVTDKTTNAVLGEFSAGHSSSHAQGVFSPVTSAQVTAIAKELAAKMVTR